MAINNENTQQRHLVIPLRMDQFDAESAKLFWSLKPEHISYLDWLTHKLNPYALSDNIMGLKREIDALNHIGGQGTFCKQRYLADRLSKSERSIRHWLNVLECLGIITITKRFHQWKWINSYTINPEFSDFKCKADGIIGHCHKADHRDCVRPEITYTCTSCGRFRGGLCLEEQCKREIEKIQKEADQKVARADQKAAHAQEELDRLINKFKDKKAAKEAKRQKKSEERRQALEKATGDQKEVIFIFEALTGKQFDLQRDKEAFAKLMGDGALIAIMTMLKTSHNKVEATKIQMERMGQEVDIKKALEMSKIYSMKYFVPELSKVRLDITEYTKQIEHMDIGKVKEAQRRPSEAVMGYLGKTLGQLEDQVIAKTILGLAIKLSEGVRGGDKGSRSCIGAYAAYSEHKIHEDKSPEERRQYATNRNIELLKEFNLLL